MSGLVFVSAPSADHKLINRLLFHLRDWEYGSEDRFCLVTTKNAYSLEPQNDDYITKETIPPIPSDVQNAWAGADLADIEAFVRDLCRSQTRGIYPNVFLLLDETGVHEKSVIVAELDEDVEGPDPSEDGIKKVRVPWDEAYLMWCNLEIANMGFEDFCEGDRVVDGWYVYNSSGRILSEEHEALRDETIARVEGADSV